MSLDKLFQTIEKGGPGSGNRGHSGIKGHRGGSSPKGGSSVVPKYYELTSIRENTNSSSMRNSYAKDLSSVLGQGGVFSSGLNKSKVETRGKTLEEVHQILGKGKFSKYISKIEKISDNEYLTGPVNRDNIAYKITVSKGPEPGLIEKNRGVKNPLISVTFTGVKLPS